MPVLLDFDLAGVDDAAVATSLEADSAENLKRVIRPGAIGWEGAPGLARMTAFLETKTIWHPIGV